MAACNTAALNTFIFTSRYIGEESVDGACKLSDDPTWIIDPIDGTVNFINGLVQYNYNNTDVQNNNTIIIILAIIFMHCTLH